MVGEDEGKKSTKVTTRKIRDKAEGSRASINQLTTSDSDLSGLQADVNMNELMSVNLIIRYTTKGTNFITHRQPGGLWK